jgi:hypothetical protein
MVDPTKITISKLEAAQRQLQTAIVLWFNGGDPVSIHALVYAAYEIIHAVSKRLNPNRRDLLFDSRVIKDQHRSEFNLLLKKHANFFKHGNRPQDEKIEFAPVASELFFIYSIVGLSTCRVPQTDNEAAFLMWLQIHNPDFLSDEGRKVLANTLSVEALQNITLLSKEEFFQVVLTARAELRRDAEIDPDQRISD